MSAAAGPVAAARQLEHFGPDHLAAIIGTVLLAVGACAVLRLSAGGRGPQAGRGGVGFGLAAGLGVMDAGNAVWRPRR